ncbi:MAG TPA: dethiobiotin synthase [Catalimonadaceae bacterium]|nr:dethiobiotin synthase [Catalimonadaceae bacterium]
MNQKGFFITAIHTDSGKTLASAILTYALKADYWKPVQCGEPADTDQIKSWLGSEVVCHPERYRLQTPASPHFAAEKEGVSMRLSDFKLPDTSNNLIVEGAGGVLVPVSTKETIADLIEHLELPVILVINHYLGALNHGMLTIRELKRRQIPLAGIIFNGEDFQNAESILLQEAGCSCLLRIPKLESVGLEQIRELSTQLQWNH